MHDYNLETRNMHNPAHAENFHCHDIPSPHNPNKDVSPRYSSRYGASQVLAFVLDMTESIETTTSLI